jgi:hypothetical protein
MNRLLLILLLCSFRISNLNAQLNGTYTIGGASPNFTTFETAAAALSSQGISGNVIFNVRPGTYPERFTILQIPGSNLNRSVTFQAENGDSSSVLMLNASAVSATNYLINLQNVGQIVLKRLSFQTPETGEFSNAISLNNTPNVRVENCHFRGSFKPFNFKYLCTGFGHCWWDIPKFQGYELSFPGGLPCDWDIGWTNLDIPGYPHRKEPFCWEYRGGCFGPLCP